MLVVALVSPVDALSEILFSAHMAQHEMLMIIAAFLILPVYGLELSTFWSLVLALTVYNGAVLGEIFRAGVLSLERGQIDAARAVGLSGRQTAALVVVPQAARRMAPVITPRSWRSCARCVPWWSRRRASRRK